MTYGQLNNVKNGGGSHLIYREMRYICGRISRIAFPDEEIAVYECGNYIYINYKNNKQ